MLQTSEPDGELERIQVLFLPLLFLSVPWPASGLACPTEEQLSALATCQPLQSPQ